MCVPYNITGEYILILTSALLCILQVSENDSGIR